MVDLRGWVMVDQVSGVVRVVVGAVLTALLVGAGLVATAPVVVGSSLAAVVRVLQLNLCDSGVADCYTGRSVAEAAAVIRAERPDVVTLNEVCRNDVTELHQVLAEVDPDATVGSAFQAAGDRRTGAGYRCRNGQEYGIGVVSRRPRVAGSFSGGGLYPPQDRGTPEERAWLCVDVAMPPAVAVCTTHLANADRSVAGEQCRYLFGTVVADVRRRGHGEPLVLGADLNLGSGPDPDLISCLPAGAVRADDGDVQHVVATPEFVVDSARTVDLEGTTDHPGLLVTLARAG